MAEPIHVLPDNHQIEASVKVYLTLVDGVWVVDGTSLQPVPLDGDVYCNEACLEANGRHCDANAVAHAQGVELPDARSLWLALSNCTWRT